MLVHVAVHGVLPTVISITLLGAQTSFLGFSDNWQVQIGPGSLTEFLASSLSQKDGQPCLYPALGPLSETVYSRHLVSTALPLGRKKGQFCWASSPEHQGEVEMGHEGLIFTLLFTHLFIQSVMNQPTCILSAWKAWTGEYGTRKAILDTAPALKPNKEECWRKY